MTPSVHTPLPPSATRFSIVLILIPGTAKSTSSYVGVTGTGVDCVCGCVRYVRSRRFAHPKYPDPLFNSAFLSPAAASITRSRTVRYGRRILRGRFLLPCRGGREADGIQARGTWRRKRIVNWGTRNQLVGSYRTKIDFTRKRHKNWEILSFAIFGCSGAPQAAVEVLHVFRITNYASSNLWTLLKWSTYCGDSTRIINFWGSKKLQPMSIRDMQK